MKLRDWTVFQGPSIAALRPCARLIVDLEPPDDADVTEAMRTSARTLLGKLANRSTGGAPPLFLANTATEFVVEAALALQGLLACPVNWGSDRKLHARTHELVFAIMRPAAVPEIAACALLLLDRVRGGAPSTASLTEAYSRMRAAMSLRLRHFVQEQRKQTAARLGIEHYIGYGMHYTYIHLGHGTHARLLAPGYTDATPYLSRDIAGDKNETYNKLLSARLPVARQQLATGEAQAIAAAREIGFPVVLKPLRGNRGRGVAVNLGDEATVRQAYRNALEIYDLVVVEKYLQGEDYRLLVIDGKFAAALLRPAPSVTGNGIATVAELIDQANQNEGRDDIFLDRFTVDAEVLRTLAEQGTSLEAVPVAGRHVLVRQAATPESMAIDVTETVHPDNRAAVVLAARACGLDVAGIDFISPDIGKSWRVNGGGIVEVNAGPGIDLHMYPQSGRSRDINFHMIRSCVPARTAGRLPTVMVTGRYDKRSVTRGIENLLAHLGYRPSDSNPIHHAPRTYHYERESAASIAAMLADKNIGAGIFDISLRDLVRDGLPIHYPGVTVLTDDLAPIWDDEHAPDTLSRVHALTVESACTAVIIDGRKPVLRKVAGRRPAWQIGYIWIDGQGRDKAPLKSHLDAGGWCVSEEPDDVGQSWIVLHQAKTRQPLLHLEDFPATDAQNKTWRATLFACAVAIALGTSVSALQRGLRAAVFRGNQSSTLIANPFPGPCMAACDPRDAVGLQRLALLVGDAGAVGRRLWLMLSADDWMLAAVEMPIRLLESPGTTWCCVGRGDAALSQRLRDAGVAPGRIISSPSLERARETCLCQAHREDTVALVDMAATERLRWCPLDEEHRPAPLVMHENAASTAWQAEELAQCFAGTWVSGPPSGWGVDAATYDHEVHLAGKLVAVPAEPDRPDLVASIENRIRSAFARGAAAVVAPLLPIDLPRWFSVLVCDDVERGMERLARGHHP